MSLSGSGSTFLPYTINGLSDASFSNSNIGNGTATTLQITSATPNKIARFDANQYLVSASVDTTDLVPYSGAVANVNLGSNTLTANKLVAPTAEIDTVKVMSSGDDYSLAVNANNLEIKNLTTNLKVYTDGESLWAPGRITAGETVYTVDTQLTGNQYFRYGTATQFSEGVNINDNYQVSDDTGASVLELSKTTGATVAKLNITSVPSATPTLALGVDGSGGVVSFAVPVATNLLPLNNTWTGTNTFNNTVAMGDTYTTNVNSAFASVQAQIANATNFATGGTDFTGTMPVCVLTKPSTYYNLSGTGSLAMSVGLDLGYTGASFTAGASTTITGSWTANTVSSRIATLTFDVSAHIGKSLRCVWEGVNSPYFLVSPYPYFTVVNGATTVFSSPQPIVGTNTFAWNFTPTVATTTITITLQASGTPSIPALAWTGFSIKQISPSRLAYKTGAKYTATFTNMVASQLMYLSVYQYNTAGGSPLAISDISNIPITTSSQSITITYSVNIYSGNLGTVVFFFQTTSPNQYVRFDSSTITRADMTISGNIQSSLVVNSSVVSANPSGNSGNGTVVNMSSLNGAFGSIEVYDNVNANKLPLALQAYGGRVGIGTTAPAALLQIVGSSTVGDRNSSLYVSTQRAGLYLKSLGSSGAEWNIWSALTGESCPAGSLAIYDQTNTAFRMVIDNTGNLGVGIANPSANLHVYMPTAVNADWASFKVKPTSFWGDGCTTRSETAGTQYATVAQRLMYSEPHVVSNSAGDCTIRLGRSGGIATGRWWDCGTLNNANFRIGLEASDTGINIDTGGKVGINKAVPAYTLDVNGNCRISSGDNSMTYYGPNATWGATLSVGAGTNKGTCQVFTTDGNLHLDALNGHAIYYGYHPNAAGNPNPHYFYGNNIQFQSSLPEQNAAYCYPVCLQGTQLFRSQCMQRRVYSNNSVAWTGGTNITYAFYKNTSNVVVKISGKLSYYVGGNTRAYPYVRTYSQSWGTYTYWSLEAFTNVGSNHTTFPFEIVLSYNDLSSPYWHDVYVYNAANCISDTNDQLWVNIEILPMGDY